MHHPVELLPLISQTQGHATRLHIEPKSNRRSLPLAASQTSICDARRVECDDSRLRYDAFLAKLTNLHQAVMEEEREGHHAAILLNAQQLRKVQHFAQLSDKPRPRSACTPSSSQRPQVLRSRGTTLISSDALVTPPRPSGNLTSGSQPPGPVLQPAPPRVVSVLRHIHPSHLQQAVVMPSCNEQSSVSDVDHTSYTTSSVSAVEARLSSLRSAPASTPAARKELREHDSPAPMDLILRGIAWHAPPSAAVSLHVPSAVDFLQVCAM
eukprot:TRINITY_DN1117_c0_g1_i4.p1 TRINITY_DN1117_c0_g1~~TRINITY_DN1117_c0_g1_i4.p1  ORF type:complete len:267 (+),score=15.89 TRINITY_DN1117_c0_g1_i4:184-984(+)